jgi:hypothetical protein
MGNRAPDHPVCALFPIPYHTELHFPSQGVDMSLVSATIYCNVPTGLTSNNSTFCPHTVFMCFVWISEQTAIISLYNINWLVFVTETECVYCAVRTGYLCINNPLQSSGHYMYRTVVTICTAQWSLCVPQWSLCVPHSGHYTYRQFNIQQFYVLPTHCIYVFCVDLRTNSHYSCIQY